MKYTAIIVEDIISASDTLQNLLLTFTEVDMLTTSSNVEDAISKITFYKPDIIFLDIKLNNRSGFEILDSCKGLFKFVVFTTAYDNFALKAFSYSTLDYLLKPIDHQSLSSTLNKIRKFSTLNSQNDIEVELNDLKKNIREDDRALNCIFIYEDKIWTKLILEDLIYVEGDKSYSKLITAKKTFMVAKNLKKVTDELSPHSEFLRIHKRYTINLNHIINIQKGIQSKVLMSNGFEIPLSIKEKEYLFSILKI